MLHDIVFRTQLLFIGAMSLLLDSFI